MARTKNIKNEEVRRIDWILCEMFKGNDAAIEKYAKVRHAQWEMSLVKRYGLRKREADKEAVQYFYRRFLNPLKAAAEEKKGEKLTGAELAEIEKEALIRLDHAVEDGCHKRCMKLMVELNRALNNLGLEMVSNHQQFLDWLTFDYHSPKDDWGRPATEKGYGFEIRIFHDKENRKEFWGELSPMLKAGKIMSMLDIYLVIREKRRRSKKFC